MLQNDKKQFIFVGVLPLNLHLTMHIFRFGANKFYSILPFSSAITCTYVCTHDCVYCFFALCRSLRLWQRFDNAKKRNDECAKEML